MQHVLCWKDFVVVSGAARVSLLAPEMLQDSKTATSRVRELVKDLPGSVGFRKPVCPTFQRAGRFNGTTSALPESLDAVRNAWCPCAEAELDLQA